jgi:hypothetical protein
MVLCRYQGRWCLAQSSQRWPGKIGLFMPVCIAVDNTFCLDEHNRYRYRSVDSLDGITFYPQLRYRGMGVAPVGWKSHSAEPIMQCMIGIPPAWTSQQRDAAMEQLKAEGWRWDYRDMVGEGYVHVDDLEKTEGPPPAGAF